MACTFLGVSGEVFEQSVSYVEVFETATAYWCDNVASEWQSLDVFPVVVCV